MNGPVLLVHFTARPGQEAALSAALATLATASRQEEGNVCYNLHTTASDSARIMLYEIWKSQAALDEHNKTAHLKAFHAQAPDLLQGKPDISFWSPVD